LFWNEVGFFAEPGAASFGDCIARNSLEKHDSKEQDCFPRGHFSREIMMSLADRNSADVLLPTTVSQKAVESCLWLLPPVLALHIGIEKEIPMNPFASMVKMFVRASFKRAGAVVAASVGIILLCLPAFSQSNAGRIVGTVTDPTGGSIAGATVTITDVQRGTSRVLTTDQAGAYSAPDLVPGSYAVRIEFKGFKTVERQNIALEVGQDLRVDLTLQPGDQTQTVIVTEVIPLVETSNAALGGTLQNQQINDLPLNGRNFENLLDLRPGVQKYPGNAGWTQASNGNRPHDNMFLVDGMDSNDPWMAQSVMNAVMAAGDAGTMLSIDAIDEFKTESNPPAEYGWKPGAVVNVGIKTGTNNIHGTGYAYGRNGDWDARDYFNVAPAEKPPVNVEQFGGSFGGPIKKDKAFYFLNFESQRYEVGSPAVHAVPITAAGVGSASQNLIGACNAARAAGTLTALSAQLTGLSGSCAPLSNYPGLFPVNNGSNGTTIQTGVNSSNRIYEGVGKVDYHLSAKHTLNLMYFISPGSGTFADNATLQLTQPQLTAQYARSQVFSANWTWTPTSTWVNEFRVGYSHYYQTFRSNDSADNPANYTYNGHTYHFYTGQTNPSYFGFPEVLFESGFDSFSLGASWPKTVGPDGVLQILDHVSYLRGNHSFKFGGEILDNRSTNNVTQNTKGPLRFTDLNAFFSGTPNRARFTAGNLLRHVSDQGYALFVQDEWRARPRLTLNLGVRYELNTIVKERDDLIGNFDSTIGPVQVGHGINSAYNGDHNNFSPRLGLAWDVRGNGKTVIRAGGGVFFEQGSFDNTMAVGNLLGLRTEPTGVTLYTAANPKGFTQGGNINVGPLQFTGGALAPIANAWANNSPGNVLYNASPSCGDGNVTLPSGLVPSPCIILGVNRNLRTPYVANWMLDIQRAVTNNLSLDVAYVGNRGIKLLGLIDLNQPHFEGGFSPGWGNPLVAGSPAQLCLASAPAYGNCAVDPNGVLEPAAEPFASKFPYLSQIEFESNNNFSTYNGLQVAVTQRTSHGLSFVLGYTYSHALGTGYDNYSFLLPVNSNNVRQLYGNTVFDVTHRLTYSVTYALPGRKSFGQLLEGWSINSIATLESSAPWGVNDVSTDFSGTGEINSDQTNGEQWDFFGNPADFKTTKAFLNTNGGQGGIPYSPGATNATCLAKSTAMGQLAVASLTNLGCYAVGGSVLVPPAYGSYGTVGVNAFRGFPFYNWDLSIAKQMKFKERLTAQFRAEFFNILNHPNISNPFGGPGGDNSFTDPTAAAGASFGFRPQTPDVTSSNPVLGSGGPRAVQLGLKLIF
jgi:hypothetical protein